MNRLRRIKEKTIRAVTKGPSTIEQLNASAVSSFEKVVDLIANLGVINAFVLSIVVALNFTVTYDEFAAADFRWGLRHESFRRFVLGTMQRDNPTFNYTIYMGRPSEQFSSSYADASNWWVTEDGEHIDLLSVLEHPGQLCTHRSGIYWNDETAALCEITSVTATILLPAFPLAKASAYWGSYSTTSHESAIYAGITTLFTLFSLIGSLLLYLSLNLSPASQGQNFERWGRYAGPILGVLYAGTIASLFCLFKRYPSRGSLAAHLAPSIPSPAPPRELTLRARPADLDMPLVTVAVCRMWSPSAS
jgi:hypothetical protein